MCLLSVPGPDERVRCRWSLAAPDFLPYHDEEWGFPVAEDHRLFEKLCLEGFQAGLSWRTILSKRDNLRSAFRDFEAIASFTSCDIDRLMKNEGIIRHRGKIEAVVNNARRVQDLVAQEGSLAAFLWRHEPDPKRLTRPQTLSPRPTQFRSRRR